MSGDIDQGRSLMNARSSSDTDDAGDDSVLQDTRTQRNRITLRTAGRALWLLTFSAGLSGLLFGYDTGVISSALVSIRSDLDGHPLTTAQKSWITAATSLFALAFSPTTGIWADKFGRRPVILFANVLFILGAAIQAFSSAVLWMITGRAAVGAAIGLASCATPLYISELAPAEIRGRLVTIQSLFITGGQVIAYLLGWGFSRSNGGWRWMVGLGVVPALLQLLMLVLMLETPRWLVKAGRHEQARLVLRKVYGGLAEAERRTIIEDVLLDIETELANASKSTTSHDEVSVISGPVPSSSTQQLINIPSNRRALTIACMLQGLQQLCGFNSLMYFSATIFSLVGFSSPIGTSLSVALTNFAFTVVAFSYIDIIGRRAILLYSIPFMVIGLSMSSLSFAFLPTMDTNNMQSQPRTGSYGMWSYILLASMMVYVAFYAVGLGCVPWQQSELFPLPVRSLGSGIATAANWSSNFIIGSTFLPMMHAFGPSLTFLLYACICLAGWIAVLFIYPETAGLQLEAVGKILRTGWGVTDSVEQFKLRKQ